MHDIDEITTNLRRVVEHVEGMLDTVNSMYEGCDHQNTMSMRRLRVGCTSVLRLLLEVLNHDKVAKDRKPRETKYLSLKDIIDEYPFTLGQLRSYLINRNVNGLDEAVRKIGKRVYFRRDLFEEWIEGRSGAV